MARSSGRRHASRLSPLLPSVAQGFRIVGPTCAAARRPADPRRVRREPAPSHHSRLAVAVQLSGGKVRLVGTRVAPDDAGNEPQVEPRRSTQVIATPLASRESLPRVRSASTMRAGPPGRVPLPLVELFSSQCWRGSTTDRVKLHRSVIASERFATRHSSPRSRRESGLGTIALMALFPVVEK